MKFEKRLVTILILLCMIFANFTVFAEEETVQTDSEQIRSAEYEAWKQIAGYLAENYIDSTLTQEEIMNMGISNFLDGNDEMLVQLLKKTLESLDDYSEFFTASEYQEYIQNLNRTFFGVGIELKKNGQYAEITGFAEEDSLAERTGFMIGDKIVKMDGIDVSERSLSEIRNMLMGDLNSTIKLTVKRNDEYIDIIATRTEVKENTVVGEILDGNIGSIKITSFGERTFDEFTEVYRNFEQNSVKKIILDLRDNPGGLVMSAVNIAKQIVPQGKIVDVEYRNSKYDTSYYSTLTSTDKNFIVLVNKNTASAAEILASAIQDSGLGRLLGEQTYGKAVVQAMYPLQNGSMYKLTTAQYITRNGRQINKVGLTPDYEVENYTEKIDVSLYTPLDYTYRYSLGSVSETVKAAKERLFMLGIYKGNVDDGIFTEDLQNSIKEYQYVHNLSASGVLDIATQVSIQNTFSMLQRVVDVQFSQAYKMFGGDIDNMY